ncbi:unnamed protein product [Penicillium pancosmium]
MTSRRGNKNGSSSCEQLDEELDFVIIGAGISGINAAHHLQQKCPNASYSLLEGRQRIGGTWDLFKYPGIRSDTDLQTFGYGWEPWAENRAIADGGSIARYLHDTAKKEGIFDHIKFGQRVVSSNWSPESQTWELSVEADDCSCRQVRCRFLILGTGYYDYKEPLRPEIPGLYEDFRGKVVHPQFWPDDLDYSGKRVVIIGSGATAITLLPNLAKKAEHVTMLQRSPTYILSVNNKTGGSLVHKILPSSWSFKLNRVMFMCLTALTFWLCRAFPNKARSMLQEQVAKQLPGHVPVDPHFQPTYNPWDQRLCFTPDGDFFESLREEAAHVETGRIKTATADGLVLESGKELKADIVVTATGLKLGLGGRIHFSLDGKPIDLADRFAWRAALLQDVPNLAFMIGYVNASWTLGVETTAQLVCRLWRQMEKSNASSIVPRAPSVIQHRSMWNLDASYVKQAEAAGQVPRCGNHGPWRGRTNYWNDLLRAQYGSITKDIEFVYKANLDEKVFHAAFQRWRKKTPWERRKLFLRAAQILEERKEKVLQDLQVETTIDDFVGIQINIQSSIDLLHELAYQLPQATGGEVMPSREDTNAFDMVLKEPLGVQLGIAPWNVPLFQGIRAVATPIACGNTAVFKSSELTPLAHRVIGQLLLDAGFPPGVLNTVQHRREDAAEVVGSLVADKRVRKVNFAGSTGVEDAVLGKAAQAAAIGAFTHHGQICMSTERILVHDAVLDSFAKKLSQFAPKILVKPGSTAEGASKAAKLIQDALNKGAELLFGEKVQQDGAHLQRRILIKVTPKMKIWSTETFAPVALLISFRTIDEAVSLANDSAYGLSSGVLSANISRAINIAQRPESDAVHINSMTVHHEAHIPHGGTKDNGWERFGVLWGECPVKKNNESDQMLTKLAAFSDFTQLKTISIANE